MSDDRTRRDDWAPTEAPRADGTREWEVFLRAESGDPLRHVGSVSAHSLDVAREQAQQLFGRWAAAFWLCPADEVRRFVAPELALDGSADERADEDTDEPVDEDTDEPPETETGADA